MHIFSHLCCILILLYLHGISYHIFCMNVCTLLHVDIAFYLPHICYILRLHNISYHTIHMFISIVFCLSDAFCILHIIYPLLCMISYDRYHIYYIFLETYCTFHILFLIPYMICYRFCVICNCWISYIVHYILFVSH